jgi:hypothetical protein
MRDVQANDNETTKLDAMPRQDGRLPWRTPAYRRLPAAGSELNPGAAADGNIVES